MQKVATCIQAEADMLDARLEASASKKSMEDLSIELNSLKFAKCKECAALKEQLTTLQVCGVSKFACMDRISNSVITAPEQLFYAANSPCCCECCISQRWMFVGPLFLLTITIMYTLEILFMRCLRCDWFLA